MHAVLLASVKPISGHIAKHGVGVVLTEVSGVVFLILRSVCIGHVLTHGLPLSAYMQTSIYWLRTCSVCGNKRQQSQDRS
jgi:hypothetical protein